MNLTTLARITDTRLIAAGDDQAVHLVWGNTSIRIPRFDLTHLAAVLDAWETGEEALGLRRGYYRIVPDPDGGLQFWFNTTALCMSVDEMRTLAGLVRLAEEQLQAITAAPLDSPFGIGYRAFAAPKRPRCWLSN